MHNKTVTNKMQQLVAVFFETICNHLSKIMLTRQIFILSVSYLCNIFELVFTLCHKCNKYNCLPWKMLNHAGNNYIIHRKQLCHPPDTVLSHRKQLYHPLVYLFCILIRSGSKSNVAVAKQSKQRSGILKRNKESTSSVFHFIWLKNVT